jgi:hypothetical protein
MKTVKRWQLAVKLGVSLIEGHGFDFQFCFWNNAFDSTSLWVVEACKTCGRTHLQEASLARTVCFYISKIILKK